jgi:hypothetical protein
MWPLRFGGIVQLDVIGDRRPSASSTIDQVKLAISPARKPARPTADHDPIALRVTATTALAATLRRPAGQSGSWPACLP